VDQPQWSELTTRAEAAQFAARVGYPVLVRPSFVLSGAAMSVACSLQELNSCLQQAADVSPDKPVVISKYEINAKEIEFDAVAQVPLLTLLSHTETPFCPFLLSFYLIPGYIPLFPGYFFLE